ncbi:hypothetical protein D3C87_1435590 [compost metagenome]
MAGQQTVQRRLLSVESVPFLDQRLQLLPGTRNQQLTALQAELAERQQATTIG